MRGNRSLYVFESVANGISKWSGTVVAYLILPMVAVPVVEAVVFRFLLNRPTIWALETTVFIYGTFFMLGGAYCLLRKRHVAMDLFYQRLALRGRVVIDIIVSFVILSICGVMLWFGVPWAWHATMIGEKASTAWGPYKWPFYWLVLVAAGLFIIQALADLIHAAHTLVAGKEVKT